MRKGRRSALFVLVVALVAVAASPVWGWQAGGQTPPGGGTPAPTPAPTPSPTPTPTQPTTPGSPRTGTSTSTSSPTADPFRDVQRPFFLSGRVMMDDGMPLAESAVIELVCNGNPRPYGYTSHKGSFSITLGQPTNVMADASVSNPMERSSGALGVSRQGFTERDLIGCELRASLPGHISESVQLTGRRFMDNPDVGTIIMHRLGKVEGVTVSLTTGSAPKDAKKAFEKGMDQAQKKKFAEAETQLKKAVEVYPEYAMAWFQLGQVQEAQQKGEDARASFQRSVAADAKYIPPHLKLMGFAVRERKWEELLGASNMVLKLNPFNYPDAWFYHSVANLQLQKLDEAEKSAREALKTDRDKRIPKINHVLGIILANKQDFRGAAQYMKTYLTAAPNATDLDFVKKQLADVEKRLSAGGVQEK